MKNKDP